MYNRQMELLEALEAQGKAMVFRPSGDIQIGTYTTDPAVMKQLYENGLDDAEKEMKELKDFLYGKKNG